MIQHTNLALAILLSVAPAVSRPAPAHRRPATAQNSICVRLMRDFISNEVVFAPIDGLNRGMLEAARLGGDRLGVESARRELEDERARRLARGDRIVTLMTGHGCTLPDHVTSPTTYEADFDACRQQPSCNVLEMALRRAGLPVDTPSAEPVGH